MAVKDLVVGNMNIVFLGGKVKHDMLDFWDEIVINVFQNDVSWGKTPKYLLKDVRIGKYGNNSEIAIVGRYVKSTVLSIKQVIENNELQPRNERHDSAPSAVFVYLLKNHILLFWGEHPGYPSVKSFRTFLHKCLVRSRRKYIRSISKGKTPEEKLQILEKHPDPYVNYIPLPLTKNIDSQFSDILKVNRLSVRQFFQNANLDYRSVMSTNQSLMQAVKSQRIDYSLVGIEDINGTRDLVKEIASSGDSKFYVDAKTEDGKKTITNDGVQYSQYFNKPGENEEIDSVAEKIVLAYGVDVSKGDIPDVPQKNSDELIAKVKLDERT